MTGKVVNLNKVRKDRARAERSARAEANSVKFGRSKAEKQSDLAKAEKANRDLDGHKLDE